MRKLLLILAVISFVLPILYYHWAHSVVYEFQESNNYFVEKIIFDGQKAIGIEVKIKNKIELEITNEITEYKKTNSKPFDLLGLDTHPYQSISYDKTDKLNDGIETKTQESNSKDLKTYFSFSHLHLHTQYSVLQASSDINEIANKALEMQMPAVAITDMYNMFGVFKFLNAILDHPDNQIEKGEELKLKPIIGCELSVCRNHKDKENKDYGFQQVFLCKNKNGYHNLSKLSSLGYVDGFYYIPRVDKDLILEYKEDLIVLSGGIKGEVSSKILNLGEEMAEESIKWWKDHFNEDFFKSNFNNTKKKLDKDIDYLVDNEIYWAKTSQLDIKNKNTLFYIKQIN